MNYFLDFFFYTSGRILKGGIFKIVMYLDFFVVVESVSKYGISMSRVLLFERCGVTLYDVKLLKEFK